MFSLAVATWMQHVFHRLPTMFLLPIAVLCALDLMNAVVACGEIGIALVENLLGNPNLSLVAEKLVVIWQVNSD